MRSCYLASAIVVACVFLGSVSANAQVTKEQIPGITNFARVETTVACAGAVKPEALAELKKMGFASVINLRLANEPGADVDAEAAAAKAAGVNFIHIPLSTQSPDPAVVDTFLKAVTTPANEPAFIHCASGNRAAAMWFVKRVLVDGWSQEKAGEEAAALGLTNPALKQFVVDYVQSHKK
jgi:uncharacterized protein (TIGR01244 family)